MLPVIVLIGLTFLTWAVAIWATLEEEQNDPLPHEKTPEEHRRSAEEHPDRRHAA